VDKQEIGHHFLAQASAASSLSNLNIFLISNFRRVLNVVLHSSG